ncbi:MAG TPA: trypsin-like peptidase domain-containing protein [Candidatus Cryosericum sp.]|nr:trypsin-like peptidase domain-containing protein [Candidatus Cryosericum sp.]
MHRRVGSVCLAVLGLVVIGTAPSWADLDRIKVGDVKPYAAESPHPYPKAWADRVFSPGAEFVRVHLTGLHLASGDYLTVSSPDRSQVWTYTGRGPHGNGDVWAFAVDGDTAIVELHGSRGGGYGYRITEVGHGTVSISGRKNPPSLEVVCGTDGRENMACHPELDAQQRPVARLLFTSGGSQFLCTGWLVAGSNSSTLMTNNHCFSTQTETSTLQALFNYQTTNCSGGGTAATSSYAGGTFLKTNSLNKRGKRGGLDYTLCTLQGNPEASWGELVATTKAAALGDAINFIQHPGGGVKEVGFWEDAAHAARCNVDTINQTYGQSASGSQTGYACDSEGGSSGSPIVDAGTGRVVVLHHFGGVTSNPCLNSGTQLSKICADAGSLLSCASN